jgi:TolB-like protein/class 3 adenylate cyclase/Flp pilus assembly protein TadD
MHRQLKAILSADVKGYSKLMGDDDESTVNTITVYRKIVAELIEKHQGRVVDSPGDNILAEFGSTLNAVNSAVKIQRTLETENSHLPDHRRMDFRIGINLGDILHKGDRIYGDGVNVAARIESLADPGGICISRGVFNQIKKKVRQGFEYMGKHAVKNIAEPVNIYRILLAPEYEGKIIGEPKSAQTKIQKPTAVAIAILLFTSAILVWLFYPRAPELEPAMVEKMAYALPERPSIAVLPFDNMSDDPAQEYFSDGMTEDLITDLSKISGIFVIARNSTFTYKGKAVKIQQVAEDLGVQYVLEGSVRKVGEKVRINVQLVNAITGYHLWAERFDDELGNIFALQDKFTQKIVAALSVKLTKDEQDLFTHKDTDNVEAYDAFLQGLSYLHQATSEGLSKAVTYFKKAVELDPEYARAHGMIAWSYQVSLHTAWYRELGWSNVRSLRDKHLQEALKDPTSYAAHRTLAYILPYRNSHEEAISEAAKALKLVPGDAEGHYLMARALVWAGKSTEAVEHLEITMRLNPNYPAGCLWFLGMARFLMGQMEEALVLGERASTRGMPQAAWLKAFAHAQLGRGQKAADILATYFEKRGWPSAPIENLSRSWPFAAQKDIDQWVDSLKKAGCPRPWNPVFRGEYDKAIADAEHAIALNPDDAKAQFAMGESLVYAGRSADAEVFLERAISLDPEYSSIFLYTLGLAQFCLEKYESAAASLEAYDAKRKKERLKGAPWWLLAATYAHLGKQQKAEEVLKSYMKKQGLKGYTVKTVLKYNLFALKDPKAIERFAQGLQKAGMPEKQENEETVAY